MTSDMKILSELIKDDALIPPHREYGKPAVLLRERDPQAQDSKITIRGLPEDALIINADVFAAPKEIFKNTRHECKRADYAESGRAKAEKSCGTGRIQNI